jgi:hypothetical protein
MQNFYLTLLSNSSMDYYNDNKTSHFTVKLPKTLTLDGKWSVALAEIHYQSTFLNVSPGNTTIFFKWNVNDIDSEHCIIEAKNYSSLKDLVNTINKCINEFMRKKAKTFKELPLNFLALDIESRFKKDPEIQPSSENKPEKESEKEPEKEPEKQPDFLSIDENKKVLVIAQLYKNVADELFFQNRLALILGYEPNVDAITMNENLLRKPQLLNGIPDEMMVYCDIIEPQVIAHTMAKIIRIVSISKDTMFGETRHKEYQRLQYIPLLKKEFETISIELRDKTGAYLPFDYGTVMIVLHFVKVE